jgi:AcrR family transcriptional regulator
MISQHVHDHEWGLYRLDGTVLLVATPETRARILAAAEDVVLGEGVGRLTLEKAAARAGVSKGGVLYHFPSRSALVSAMVARLAERVDESLAAEREANAGAPGAYARAYVEDTFAIVDDEESERGQRLGAAVLAAMASEPELLAPLREAFARWQAEIESDVADPVRGTVARLAADGLWLCELFGLGPLDPELRRSVHAELLRMVE